VERKKNNYEATPQNEEATNDKGGEEITMAQAMANAIVVCLVAALVACAHAQAG
jgi:hypothetical protein